ncbi:unnamed protein product [Peniophora sp. CBMAI 1063]|nr:unnamed protein product [Peniophora sp. CBMAI 1063]
MAGRFLRLARKQEHDKDPRANDAKHRARRVTPRSRSPSPLPRCVTPCTKSISKTPPEVLVEIFRCLRDSTATSPLSRALHWQSVSHVSRQWRAAALADSLLWTTVPLEASQEMISCFLERSNGLPLRILFTPVALFCKIGLLRDNAARIKALVQTQGSWGAVTPIEAIQDVLRKVLATDRFPPIPQLEEVYVYPYGGYQNVYELLHQHSFLHSAPSLRSLSILNGSDVVSLRAINAPQLRSLVLGGIPARRDASQLTGLFQCIRGCLLLEELSIGDCYIKAMQDQDRAILPIELLHLRRLRLSGDVRVMLAILSALVFHCRAAVIYLHADLDTCAISEGGFDSALPVLTNGLGMRGDNRFAWTTFVDTRSHVEAGFDIGNAAPSFVLRFGRMESWTIDGQRSIDITKSLLKNAMDAVWAALGLGATMDGIRTLALGPYLRDGEPVRSSELREAYDWCANIEVVEVPPSHLMALCDALIDPMADHRGYAFMPALKRIKLKDPNGPRSGSLLLRGTVKRSMRNRDYERKIEIG